MFFPVSSLTKPSQCVTMRHKSEVVIIFAEKLDFLMRLTSTTNSRLASAINVDPSLVSKLRSGVRSVSAKSDYLLPMSTYFGSKCGDSYRSLTLLELIGADFGSDIVSSLMKWFLDDEKTIDLSCRDTMISGGIPKRKPERKIKEKHFFFHGSDAESEAVRMIEEIIRSSENIRKVKLFSDCSNGNGGFDLFLSCKDLLYELIGNGVEIIRVLPDYYDLNKTVSDIFAWMPMLADGNIKSYYFKGFRDRVFSSSMFIVPGVAAMISENVSGAGPTVVTTEKETVADYERMFDSYLSFCAEGSKTELYSEKQKGKRILDDFFELKDDLCNVFNSLPYEWTPSDLFADIAIETDICIKRADDLRKLMKTNTVTEIFPILSPCEIAQGKAVCFAESLVKGKRVVYTAQQYSKHLEAILNVLENEPNYNVIPSSYADSFDYNICIKKNSGAIKLPETTDGFCGIISHQPSVSAVWQYYMNGNSGINEWDFSKEKTKRRIENLISELRK